MEQILESKLSSLIQSLPERYKVIGTLGQGGMGVVFHATDVQLQRDVAIKFLLFEGNEDSSLQERFLKEAKTLSTLNHPNIVRFYNSGISENGIPFHVMEYLQGPSLSEEMKKNPQEVKSNLRTIANQLLSALQHAHSHEIAHRDLKPSNVILCHDENGALSIKLIDFGIARQLDSDAGKTLTKSSAMLGSPGYMSPEQCKGQRGDKRSDFYSLACILHEIISGKPVFEGETGIEIMYKQMNDEVAKLQLKDKSGKESELSLLIDSCLQKDPDMRPSSADEISRRLKDLNEAEWTGLQIEQESNAGVLAKLGLLFAIIFLLGVILCAFWFWRGISNEGKDDSSLVLRKKVIKNSAKEIELAKSRVKFALRDLSATKKESQDYYDKLDTAFRIYRRLILALINSGKDSDLEEADQACSDAVNLARKEKDKSAELSALVQRADLALRRADLGDADRHLHDADGYYSQGAQIIEARNDSRKLELQDLILHRGFYYFKTHNFDRVIGDLETLHGIWKYHVTSPNIGVNQLQTIDPDGINRIPLFCNLVKNFETLKFESDSDKVAMLKLYTLLIKLCRDTSSNDLAFKLAHEAQIQMGKVKGHDDLKGILLKEISELNN